MFVLDNVHRTRKEKKEADSCLMRIIEVKMEKYNIYCGIRSRIYIAGH